MRSLPGEDFVAYLRDYTAEMTASDEDAPAVVDRYHAPDIVWTSDGNRLDRDQLVAHVVPVRRNARTVEVEVHEVLRAGDLVAARYTLRASLRRGRDLEIDGHLFGTLGADGRLRRVDQVTRTRSG